MARVVSLVEASSRPAASRTTSKLSAPSALSGNLNKVASLLACPTRGTVLTVPEAATSERPGSARGSESFGLHNVSYAL